MSYLQSIPAFSQSGNLGGIITMQVIRASDVQSMGEPVNGIIYDTIVLKEGKAFVNWSAILESARVRNTSRTTREGSSRQVPLNFMLPKDRPGIKAQLDQAEADEFIVLYTDTNGTQKIFGTLETPVRFEYDHDTGASFSNLNAYDCRFYYTGPDNLFHYNGTIPVPVPGSAPAVVRYNGVAIASLAPGETLNIESDFGFTDFYVTT
jgi:hypothetical protein